MIMPPVDGQVSSSAMAILLWHALNFPWEAQALLSPHDWRASPPASSASPPTLHAQLGILHTHYPATMHIKLRPPSGYHLQTLLTHHPNKLLLSHPLRPIAMECTSTLLYSWVIHFSLHPHNSPTYKIVPLITLHGVCVFTWLPENRWAPEAYCRNTHLLLAAQESLLARGRKTEGYSTYISPLEHRIMSFSIGEADLREHPKYCANTEN